MSRLREHLANNRPQRFQSGTLLSRPECGSEFIPTTVSRLGAVCRNEFRPTGEPPFVGVQAAMY